MTSKKSTITPAQFKEITWLKSVKGQGVHVGEWHEYVVLSKTKNPKDVLLVYDHAEWDAFVKGVANREFDDLAANAK